VTLRNFVVKKPAKTKGEHLLFPRGVIGPQHRGQDDSKRAKKKKGKGFQGVRKGRHPFAWGRKKRNVLLPHKSEKQKKRPSFSYRGNVFIVKMAAKVGV